MKTPDQPHSNRPFKEEPRPVDLKGNPERDRKLFSELESHPNKIIRRIYELSLADLDAFKGVLETLESFGIHVPKVDFFIEKSEYGHDVISAVVEKVQGENLISLEDNAKTKEEKKFVADLIEQLYINLSEYLIGTDTLRLPQMRDIYKTGDYVYGTTSYDSDKKVYLVDLDPYFERGRWWAHSYFKDPQEAFDHNENARRHAAESNIEYFGKVIEFYEKSQGKFVKFRKTLRSLYKKNPRNILLWQLLRNLGELYEE